MSAAAYRAWAPTSTGSVSKTLWNPPTGGGPGTQPVKRGAKPGGGGGITGVKMAYPPAPAADKLKGGYTAESSSVEHKVIENLKKQVQLLEADNRALQELGPQAARGGGGGGAETRHAELAQQQREAELQAAAEQLRKEALAARLRERKALEEMSEAKEHLVQQREKFATARQELTAEVIAYQRDLDTLTQDKRQLQADLEDVKAELHSRQDFVQGVDAQVRLLESQLHEKAGEAARALGREAALKVELGEERVRLEQVKDKYENLRAAQGQMEGMRASQQATSERATAELRLAQMALEQESEARRKAEDDKQFLVHETAKLEGTIADLSSSAEYLLSENKKLRRDAAENKVMKAVGRYMVRKMREKLIEARDSETRMRENQTALHARYVASEQRSESIERELMVLRRRQAEREALFEQGRTDASELSVENRMLLERAQELALDTQRAIAKHEQLDARNTELAAEVEFLRDRLDVQNALASFRPEDLASISRVNAALSDKISELLPKLHSSTSRPAASSQPAASGLLAPAAASASVGSSYVPANAAEPAWAASGGASGYPYP